MALVSTSSFSTGIYSRLQSAKCSLCTTSSSTTNASLITRLPLSSSTNLAQCFSSASCSKNFSNSVSSSGVNLDARAPCRAQQCQLGSQTRRESLLTTDFLSTQHWNWRRVVGRQSHLQQRFSRGGALQVRAARMESGDVKVGFRAPDFELLEPLTGKTVKLDDFEDQQGLLVMFICNHCPFVIHLKESIAKFAQEYSSKGLGIVAISSNSVVTHPQDGPRFMADDAKKFGYVFPYVYDETQEVAKAFGAVCTPDFFLFKKDGRRPFELVYHGRFDETRPRSTSPITGQDLRAAVDSILKGLPVKSDQRPSMGCSIKWHPGK